MGSLVLKSRLVLTKVVGSLLLLGLTPVSCWLWESRFKLDSVGRFFFRQKRFMGFNNELIEVFQFRSMYVDQGDHNASKLVTKEDPRVTRVGRFIRKTSPRRAATVAQCRFQG